MLRKGLHLRMTGEAKYSDYCAEILKPVIGELCNRQCHSGGSERQATDEGKGAFMNAPRRQNEHQTRATGEGILFVHILSIGGIDENCEQNLRILLSHFCHKPLLNCRQVHVS